MQYPPYLQQHPDGALLRLHIQPNASTTEIVGMHGDRLKVKLSSPPRDGKANKELISFLRKILGVPKQQIVLVRGKLGRQKDILVKNDSLRRLYRLWPSSV
ncbi:MAG: DUF167 domain-containing protein [Candidatus Pacebacteria bacterium]|nr:DUF167 domain-containing protein [Candidatus Paceibacterota bacterium]